jgi:Sec-independent protein translocase protein TatA
LLDGVSPVTLVFIGAIAVLLFGEHLPEVARTFGKKFADLRKNVQSIQDEIRSAATAATSDLSSALDINTSSSGTTTSSASDPSNGTARKRRSRDSDEDYEEATAPRFVPPPRRPTDSPGGSET